MKKLYLIRHAKSSWDNPDLDDFERPLNSCGEKDAPSMGKRLKKKNLIPDVVITSPARRALDTCIAVTNQLGFAKENIITDKRIYHANEEELLAFVRQLKDHPKDDDQIVLLFGHNPGLTNFVNRLANEAILNIPTCGVVAVSFSIKKWKEVSWGCGKMILFDFPKNKKEN